MGPEPTTRAAVASLCAGETIAVQRPRSRWAAAAIAGVRSAQRTPPGAP